ncbi:MAG: hypothetical protein AAFY99_00095 [Pseudomonadota bacterium]
MKVLVQCDGLGIRLRAGKRIASMMAATVLAGGVIPAYATIDNTATVTGTAPDSTVVTVDDTESVDVEGASPSLEVVKSANTAGPVAAGDTITYTFAVENTGNQTLTDVTVTDPHDANAAGTLSAVLVRGTSPLTDNGTSGDSTNGADNTDWDTLAPGDIVFFEATYVVQQADITNQVGTTPGGGDGEFNNIATATAFTPADIALPGGPSATDDSNQVDVTVDPVNSSLLVAKVGTYDPGTGAVVVDGSTDNLAVGDVVTYTYTITNNGNVPIDNITLSDAHGGNPATFTQPDIETASLTDNGSTGDSTNPTTGDSDWDVLAPGDVLEVSVNYTIDQFDIDNNQ